MRDRLRAVRRDRRGATAIEYGLVASLIVVAMLVAFGRVATTSSTMWTKVSTRFVDASGSD